MDSPRYFYGQKQTKTQQTETNKWRITFLHSNRKQSLCFLISPPRCLKILMDMVAVGRQGAIDPEVQWKQLEDCDISQTEMASAATCRWLGCC